MIDPELQLLLAQPARQTEARSRSRSRSRSRDVVDAARPTVRFHTLAAPTAASNWTPIGDPVVIVYVQTRFVQHRQWQNQLVNAGDSGPAAPTPRVVLQSWCAPLRWTSRAGCPCAAHCRTASLALPVLEMTPQGRPLWLRGAVVSRHQQVLA